MEIPVERLTHHWVQLYPFNQAFINENTLPIIEEEHSIHIPLPGIQRIHYMVQIVAYGIRKVLDDLSVLNPGMYVNNVSKI